MVEITRILCPVDFSEHSQHALAHAAALARWYGAKLTVQFVYGTGMPPAALAPGLGPMGAEAIVLTDVDRRQFIGDLQRFAATAGTAGVDVEFKVVEGPVVQNIADEARDAKAELIVVGTHGRSGFERLVLGSVTQKLLRKAPCSVLTVPPASDAPPAPQLFARILVALDFSKEARRALDYALSLAQEANAHLTALHVVDMPDTSGEWVTSTNDMETFVRQVMDNSRKALTEAIPASAREWCEIAERLEAGRPYREILRVADEERAALIVLGAHGHGVLDRVFFGSTAEHVVRQAHCPVLTVRS